MKTTNSISRDRQQSKQQSFLDYFRRSGCVMTSARCAGVSRQLVYYWRDTSPLFEKTLREAGEAAEKENRTNTFQNACNLARKGDLKILAVLEKTHGADFVAGTLRGNGRIIRRAKPSF